MRGILRFFGFFLIFLVVVAIVLSIAAFDFWVAINYNFPLFFIVLVLELAGAFALIEATD